MKKRIYTVLIISAAAAKLYASSAAITFKAGYAPDMGGSMYSGWQAENLGVYDGVNDINRSGNGITVSTIEPPVGIAAGAEARLTFDSIYIKSGADINYSFSGGSGSTINDFGSGDEKVDVSYNLWFFYVPVTAGIVIEFWDEARIYVGGGAAFAYGTYSNSFSSASAEHSASFTGYGIPLVAELGCEYLVGNNTAICCGITYLHGRSAVIEDGSDFARIDFTGYSFTAGLQFYYDFQAD